MASVQQLAKLFDGLEKSCKNETRSIVLCNATVTIYQSEGGYNEFKI